MSAIRSLGALLEEAKRVGPRTVAVACAQDEDVLQALEGARREGICRGILVGDRGKVEAMASKLGVDLSAYELVDEPEEFAAGMRAVSLVSEGKADILMKGLIKTANFLKAVLDKEKGLRTGSLLSHVYIHEVKGYDRLLFVTDPAMNIAPTLSDKVKILENAVKLAHAFGIERPRVAVLAAVEVVNPDMPATLDAAALVQMNRRGQIKGCLVDGPLALDNALSLEACRHKGIDSPVGGEADVLLVPDIESGNMLSKAIVYTSENRTAGIVLGARKPVVLTSRADSADTKLLSVAVAVVLSARA